MKKGYYTEAAYYGWVKDRYMCFENEGAYLEYVKEQEEII